MNRIISFIIIAMMCTLLYSVKAQNVAINNNGSAPDNSAMLDVSSTTKGALLPRMTKSQRDLIPTPATGLLIFQTDDTPGFYINLGTTATSDWQKLVAGNETPASIKDADNNTKIQVEESSDENMIRFDVNGSEAMVIDDNANIGMGTSNPNHLVEINTLTITDNPMLYLNNTNTSEGDAFLLFEADASENFSIGVNGSGNKNFVISNSFNLESAERFTIDGVSGNVGIGTTTSTSLLDIAGDIEIGTADAFYFGDPDTDGTWRIMRDGDSLSFERRESSVWISKMKINP